MSLEEAAGVVGDNNYGSEYMKIVVNDSLNAITSTHKGFIISVSSIDPNFTGNLL